MTDRIERQISRIGYQVPNVHIGQLCRNIRHGGPGDPILDFDKKIFGAIPSTIDTFTQISRLRFSWW